MAAAFTPRETQRSPHKGRPPPQSSGWRSVQRERREIGPSEAGVALCSPGTSRGSSRIGHCKMGALDLFQRVPAARTVRQVPPTQWLETIADYGAQESEQLGWAQLGLVTSL